MRIATELALEQERIFEQMWFCAVRSSDIGRVTSDAQRVRASVSRFPKSIPSSRLSIGDGCGIGRMA